MQFYDEKPDMDWVFKVHIPAYMGTELHNNTQCMILHGNEDNPNKVELFAENHYQCKPTVFICDGETGNLIKE